jgi:hypothetical protein
MCTEEQWEVCNTSKAYHAAKQFALILEEQARLEGFKPKSIKVRTKEQVIKGGFGKADAQVIWDEGPELWTEHVKVGPSDDTDCTVEGNTVSFYTRYG